MIKSRRPLRPDAGAPLAGQHTDDDCPHASAPGLRGILLRQLDAAKRLPWQAYVLLAVLLGLTYSLGYAARGQQDLLAATAAEMGNRGLRSDVDDSLLPAVGNDGDEIVGSDGDGLHMRASEHGSSEGGSSEDASSSNIGTSEDPGSNDDDAALSADDERADEQAALSVADLYAQPFQDLTQLSDEQLFENWEEFQASPDIFVPNIAAKPSEWHGVQAYCRLYRERPIKRFVPVLRREIQLNEQNFRQRFRVTGQPVLFRMDNMRKAGYTGRPYTFPELDEMFPYNADASVHTKTFSQYKPNAKFDGEVDLGPGLAALRSNATLVKKKGLRNLPRNMKIQPDALRKLKIRPPPLFPRRWMQRGSLWMGNGASNTASHSDCCDNIVVMIAGVKRFSLAPPSDFHLLNPRCVGKNKGLCYGDPADPSAPEVDATRFNRMMVDVKPGELLYMPAGFFHHVANLGSSLMINHWVYGKDTVSISLK